MNRSYVIPVTEAQANDRLTLVSVINFVLRNIKVMVVVGLVFAVLVGIQTSRRPDTYTATTSFITEGDQPPGRLILGGVTLPGTAGRGPEFYLELMRSPVVLAGLAYERIEADSGKPAKTLMERYAPWDKEPQRAVESTIGQIQRRMSSQVSLQGIITLKVTAEHPRLAAGIAQGILKQIDDFNNNKRKSQASAERLFAQQRMVEVGAEVRAVEERWRLFHERNRQINSPALQLEDGHISDELSTKRSLYSAIVQAHERAKMDEVRDSPRAIVLANPLPPTTPDRRPTIRNTVLAFFAGMILAALAATIREYFARIPQQPSAEATEFAALRAESTEQLRRPIRALMSAVRKSRQTPLQ
jgi:uncharacterized protein involved in exopolysaccharide biosynthesis